MKLLMLGAGSVGGFFGGLLQQGGADVTFLVRPKRAAQLRDRGLRIQGPKRELHLSNLQLLESASQSSGAFDAVILSCKAYDLTEAIEAVGPYVQKHTLVLPLLNGLKHLQIMDRIFGEGRVLGGTAQVSVAVDANGDIRQLTEAQTLIYGPRSATPPASVVPLEAALKLGKFEARLSPNIMLDMWEKYVLLASLAGMTCLMRANVGEIVATKDGAALMLKMLADCAGVAAAAGNAPRVNYMSFVNSLLTQANSTLDASMRRDMAQGRRIEADHIVGDMLNRAVAANIQSELLKSVYCNLQAYEQRLTGGAALPR